MNNNIYYVERVYDDMQAVLVNAVTKTRLRQTKRQLTQLAKEKDIIGVWFDGELNDIVPHSMIEFESLDEAENYEEPSMLIVEHSDTVFGFVPNNNICKAYNIVYCADNIGITYVSNSGHYTHNLGDALKLSEDSAISKANSMTKNSRTGRVWRTKRIEYRE